MAAASVTTFAAIAGLLIAAPGPDWAFTLSAVSRRQSLTAAVLGLVIGYVGMTIAVATGLGLLVARTPALLTILTVLGAGYLLWLGWHTWRAPGVILRGSTDAIVAPAPWRSTLMTGIAVSGLNPKALLIFVALLPQFTRDDTAWPISLQLVVLGLVFTVLVGGFYPILGTVARTFVLRSPRVSVLLTRSAGGVMIVLGLILLWERIR